MLLLPTSLVLLLAGGVASLPVPSDDAGPRQRWQHKEDHWASGESPLVRSRVFMTSATVPDPPRSGFHYPRHDARLHDGDEVQLHTSRSTWLAVTDNPLFVLSDRTMALQEGSSGRFCGASSDDLSGKIVCGRSVPKRSAWFEVRRVDGKITLRISGTGKYCSDSLEGIRCVAENVSALEMFGLADLGGGRIGLQGSRHLKFCADGGDGLTCDHEELSGAAVFKPWTGFPLEAIFVQTHEQGAAETFIVSRSDLSAPAIALRCKKGGRYLAANAEGGTLGCTSSKPWMFTTDRASWWDQTTSKLQALETGSYLMAGSGREVKLQSKDGDGDVLWKVYLTGGFETIRPLVRGVNLGNWFLLEKWMAQALFYDEDGARDFEDGCDAMDEYGLMKALGPEVGRRRMDHHWSTWITEEDIAWMGQHGINAVRVPFGYWMVLPEPPFVHGQLPYLDRLFKWCEKHGVAVLLDFHGLKGSQTGNPTSGNCGGCGNQKCGKTWLRFLEEQNMNLEVVSKLASRFSRSKAYLGFAVANEVSNKVNRMELMAFYQRAYDIIRSQNEDALIVLYTTHSPSKYPFTNCHDTATDIHIYFGWGFGHPSLDQYENLRRARNAVAGVHWPVLIGEWSLAANGHPTLSWEAGRRDHYFEKFAKMQLQAWETHSTGWFYWSYKTRLHNSTWNYRDMCEVGWLPGCAGGSLKFATTRWWEAPTCAYAYLDGQCMDESVPPPHEPPEPHQPHPLVAFITYKLYWLPLLAACLALYVFRTLKRCFPTDTDGVEGALADREEVYRLPRLPPQFGGWRAITSPKANSSNVSAADGSPRQLEARAVSVPPWASPQPAPAQSRRA